MKARENAMHKAEVEAAAKDAKEFKKALKKRNEEISEVFDLAADGVKAAYKANRLEPGREPKWQLRPAEGMEEIHEKLASLAQ